MKILKKLLLVLGLVAVTAQPAKAEFENLQDQKSVGSTLFYGALCCGAAGLAKAAWAATYTVKKAVMNNANTYIIKTPAELFVSPNISSRLFRKNFGEAVICGALAYGLYALSQSYLKTV